MDLIDGVVLTPLKKITDERGMVLHMMRDNSPIFDKFGEVYFSYTNPGVVKGWKKHLKLTGNMSVPVGEVKFVLFDDRENSKTKGMLNEVTLSLENYQLLTVPPNIWYSFKATSEEPSMIANCTNLSHQPNEVEGVELESDLIPYEW